MEGYMSYQDPALQPPPEPVLLKTCQDCDYYRDVYKRNEANGLVHVMSFCVYELFQADTFAELAGADLIEVEPEDEPCRDFREDTC